VPNGRSQDEDSHNTSVAPGLANAFPAEFDFTATAPSGNVAEPDDFDGVAFVGHSYTSVPGSDGFDSTGYTFLPSDDDFSTASTVSSPGVPVVAAAPTSVTQPVTSTSSSGSNSGEILARYRLQAASRNAQQHTTASMLEFDQRYQAEASHIKPDIRDIPLSPEKVQEIKEIMKTIKISYLPNWARDFEAKARVAGGAGSSGKIASF